MKALYYAPGKAPELFDVSDPEEFLGGEIETFWPFDDLEVCFIILCDQEEPNRELPGRIICGPFLVAGDDFTDISDEDAAAVEASLTWAEQVWEPTETDPFEEDAQEEESFGTIQIVDEETFYQSLKGEECL